MRLLKRDLRGLGNDADEMDHRPHPGHGVGKRFRSQDVALRQLDPGIMRERGRAPRIPHQQAHPVA